MRLSVLTRSRLMRRVAAPTSMLGDGLLAVVLMAGADAVASDQGTLDRRHALVIALVVLPLTLRSANAIAAALAVGFALLLNQALDYTNSLFEDFVFLVAGYTMVSQARWGRGLLAAVVAGCVGVNVSLLIGWHNAGRVNWGDVPYNYLLASLPLVVGYSIRTRRAYIGELDEHGRALARAATVEERNRVARELHDVIAHSVSVMVWQATAASRVGRRDPAAALPTFDVIQETGRAALSDLRRVIGLLRTSADVPGDREPQPDIDQLGALVAGIQRAGMPVTLRTIGEPHPLPPGIGLAAYRIVQESLTNVLKHANADNADITVTYGDGELRLEINDDGDGSTAALSGGNGLKGMRERAMLYGGQVRAERLKRGFRVVASLPTQSGSDAPLQLVPTPAP